ncbi:YciI family protein [Streptomyces sp. NPDC049040]|uniref:YciI family protein n=1 Tax=Streptomyces sp. NPDC049040 TaxID=3365593 RepID=UPI00371E019D
MTRYLLLIHDNEADYQAADDTARRALDEAHEAFAREHKDVIVTGEHLQPTSTATVVREDGAGGHLVTDGAYAETKEALGGYYIIEVSDLDAALAVAKRLPFFGRTGDAAVEVRPLY